MTEDLITRLRKRAEIRLQISTRKSVQENKPDRIAELLLEAANRIEQLESDRQVLLSGKQLNLPFDEGAMQRACTKVMTEQIYRIND